MFWQSRNEIKENTMTTGWILIGLGALVTLLGYTVLDSNERLRAGMKGFGLGNMLLGALDMLRPSLRQR